MVRDLHDRVHTLTRWVAGLHRHQQPEAACWHRSHEELLPVKHILTAMESTCRQRLQRAKLAGWEGDRG